MQEQVVTISEHRLTGDLRIPNRARALVLFAHGSGSSRRSPRNRYVAGYLNRLGLATLLMDLLTEAEDRDASRRFDIDVLALRLEETLEWLSSQPAAKRLPLGLFGASTGAAAALVAAAHQPDRVFAVVSRGGRPDLAEGALASVRSPTLLIVGGEDRVVLELNESARRKLPPSAELEVVPGATHLFEEPGALDAVADLAAQWFLRHAPSAPALQSAC